MIQSDHTVSLMRGCRCDPVSALSRPDNGKCDQPSVHVAHDSSPRRGLARTSLIIQEQQHGIVDHMLKCAKLSKSGAIPNAHRIAASYDFDCALVAVPPLEA